MIDNIHIFVRVVESESFSGAARLLDLPQSTVSRRVRQLEDELGVRLLERTTRCVKPTHTGAIYFQRCLKIVRDLDDASNELLSSQKTPSGLLRITAPVESIHVFLDDILNDFLREYPSIEIDVVASNELFNPIDKGFDVAIRLADLKDSSLIARPLGKTTELICAAPRYIDKYGMPHTPKELKEHNCLRMSNGEIFSRWEGTDNDQLISVPVTGNVIVNSLTLLHKLTLEGHGIAKLPTYLCASDIEHERLKSVVPEWYFPKRTLWVLYSSSRHLTPKVRAFVDFIIEQTKGYGFLQN